MILDIVFVIGGLVALALSADKFIESASKTASHFGMSPLLIGMIIVGFGTSLPEMIVSAFAALDDSPGIALGNAYGSNIANIGLVLGTAILISPIMVGRDVVRRELPILIAITLACGALMLDGTLSQLDAVIMLVGVVAQTIYAGLSNKQSNDDDNKTESDEPRASINITLIWLVGSMIVLMLSSKLLVTGATNIATALGVSELVIGLTIVAIGTSLPELAAAVAAAKQNEDAMLVGNIVGSCVFNVLAVVGIAAVIKPFSVPSEFVRDFIVTLGFTVALWLISFVAKKGLQKPVGFSFLAAYIVYMVLVNVPM